MFVNTFQPEVLLQMQMRRIYNSQGLQFLNTSAADQIKEKINASIRYLEVVQQKDHNYFQSWGTEWTTRYPFVYAYSNVRYWNTSSKTYNTAWSEYGVLASSMKIVTDNNGGQDIFSLANRSMNVYDFYQQPSANNLSGFKPRPLVQGFSVDKRTANNTLRNVSLKVVCFSYDQFIGIRDYFGIPGTSITLQYGYIKPSVLSNILAPHISNSLPDDLAKQQGYLSTPSSDGAFIKNGGCQIQRCTAVVVGYEIDQLDNRFTLEIKMMTQGTSQLLSLIRQSLPAQIQTGKKDKTTDKVLETTFVTQLRSLAQNFKDQWKKEVISVPTSQGQKTYVTLSWAINIIMQQIRMRSKLFYFDSIVQKKNVRGDKLITSVVPGNPIGKFSAPMYLPQGIRSYDMDVLIWDKTIDMLPQDNSGVPYRSMYVGDDYGKTMQQAYLYSPIDVFKTVYMSDEILRATQIVTGINYQLGMDDIKQKNIEYWMAHYDTRLKTQKSASTNVFDRMKGAIPSDSVAKLVFLGNVYIRLQRILSYINTTESISMIQFVNQLLTIISSSTGLQLQCYSQELRGEVVITQKSVFYSTPTEFYRIPNFGNDSIVKNAVFSVKMPDKMGAGIIASYNARTGDSTDLIQNIFKRLFGHRNQQMVDLHSFSKNNLTMQYFQNTTTETTSQEPTKKVQVTYQSITGSFYKQVKNKKGNILNVQFNVQRMNDSTVRSLIQDHNMKLISKQKNLCQKHANISMYQYSMYHMTVELTLDFISGLSFGQMFKLQFNPLGWQAAFVTTAADHSITDRGAETKITGIMFGVSVMS